MNELRSPLRRYGRRRLLGFVPGWVGVASLSACAAGGDLRPLPPGGTARYRLGTGDQVRIVVFDQKQLTADYTVGDGGMIDLPLLGPLRAAGSTVHELALQIGSDLQRRGILRRPNVAVEVRKYRPFSILGEVNKPGQYRFQPGMTVLTAVSIAGGFTFRALQSRVGIIRVRQGHAVEYRAAPDALIAPGDVVKVFERHF